MNRGLRFLGNGLVRAVGTALQRWAQSPLFLYSPRYSRQLSHLILSRAHLHEILDPQPDEQILEINPQTGYYAVDIARWLDSGTLAIIDRQNKPLKQICQSARERLGPDAALKAVCGDAQAFPYPADHFDAVYLVRAFGRIPDQQQALQEIHRVLKPGGRLVVGEVFHDPNVVRFETFWEWASRARFQFAGKRGGRVGYFARFAVGKPC
jgi:ubiquinone/menaquinone biosynthesis C-methylase UbiE